MDELIKIGALNLEDLEINRSGELSERQKRDLKFWVGFWIVLAGMEFTIFTAYIYFQVFFRKNLPESLISSALFIVLIYICITFAKPFWQDFKNDEVKTSSGILYKKIFAGGRSNPSKYSVRVNNHIFLVSPTVYDSLAEEEPYRIYYVPNSRRLVNIESL